VSATRESRRRAYVERTAVWIPAVIIGLLALPMAVTHRSFGHDWTLHLWAVRQQQWNIEAMGHPGLFVSAAPLGAFYPVFSFVGSGIYSVGGYLAIALGDQPIVAYKLLFVAGLCLAYGGFTWLSVQLGLRGWRSQVPGAVLVTGAYYITDMAGRGDFAEFIAVSSIPFLVAAACHLLTSDVVGRRHRVALVVAVFVLSGSHNITLLWGTVFVVLLALVAAIAWGPTWHRPLPWRRVARVIGLGAVGAGLNAWYLFPDLAYGLDTVVGRVSSATKPGTIFVHWPLLLNPFRPADHSPSLVPFFARDIRLSFPCLFLAFVLVAAGAFWRGKDGATRRFLVGLVALTGAFVFLCVSTAPWGSLPHFFWSIQFTWRVDSYVLLSAALLVMIALAWQASAGEPLRRVSSIVVVAIVVFNVGAATWQVWRVRSEYVRTPFEVVTHGHFAERVVASHYVVPPSWYSGGDFRDGSAPVIAVSAGRTMTVPLQRVHGSSFSGTIAVPDGPAPFTTNIAAGPRFVRMGGITAVGRTPDGFVVAVRADRTPAVGPVVVTIHQAGSALLRAGSLVSLMSALGFVVVLVLPVRRLRSGSRPESGA
jgi:hypothetical protein